MTQDDDNETAKPTTKPTIGRRSFLKVTAISTAGLAAGCGSDMMVGPDAGPTPPEPGMDSGPATPPPAMDATAPAPPMDANRPLPSVDADPPGDAGGEPDAGTEPPPEPPETVSEVATFELGVSSGDVTRTQAMIQTRYSGDRALDLVVWEMDGSTYRREHLRTMVMSEDGGFIHHDVSGLNAGARYRYAFFEMDGEDRIGRSPIGRFRAATGMMSLESLVLGAVSCTSNRFAKDTLSRAGEAGDIDVFMMLGDTTYNDGARTVDEYRGRWAESLGSLGWRDVRQATSILATWDDHEVTDNFDPEVDDTTIASRVMFESLPLRPNPTAPERLWKSMRWGLTAEIFILDCRSERRPSTRGSTDQYLSRSQMDWLKAGLRDSPCVFKIIMNSVPISDFPFPFDIGGNQEDRWEGYPLQRNEILGFIDTTPIDGVLWVAGDFHLASEGRLANSGVGSTQREILAGPGAQVGNPGAFVLTAPQFDWSSTRNNYTRLELDPMARQITVDWINEDGRSLRRSTLDF